MFVQLVTGSNKNLWNSMRGIVYKREPAHECQGQKRATQGIKNA